MARYDKHFTVIEARVWVVDLRARFARIRELMGLIQGLESEYMAAEKVVRSNGKAPHVSAYQAEAEELQRLLQELVDAGIEVKDVARGLVDFPHWRDGEEVFLCWELADEELAFWHRIEDGYAGRQPL